MSGNPEDNSPSHNISKFFISNFLTHLRTIPNLDGSFSGFNVSTCKQEGQSALRFGSSGSIGAQKMASTMSQNRSLERKI